MSTEPSLEKTLLNPFLCNIIIIEYSIIFNTLEFNEILMDENTSLTSMKIINLVKYTTKSAITTYLKKRVQKGKTSEHVILDRLFPRERQVRSMMGGLETSLGTTLWEPLAIELAKANQFSHLNNSDFTVPTPIPSSIIEIMNRWNMLRLQPNADASLKDYVEELREHVIDLGQDFTIENQVKIRKGDGIDVWIAKDGIEYAFDIKTVQNNAKNGNSYNSTLMSWYAYRILNNPTVQFQARIAFPYSPFKPYTVESLWQKSKGRLHPIKQGEDAWAQEEFWDFISGQEDSWLLMLQAFDELREEGFGEQLKGIFYSDLE